MPYQIVARSNEIGLGRRRRHRRCLIVGRRRVLQMVRFWLYSRQLVLVLVLVAVRVAAVRLIDISGW